MEFNSVDLFWDTLLARTKYFPLIRRSKENHASLFRLMETENAVMRSYIDGVELLIFTSKQLHVESQGKLSVSFFSFS